MLPFGYVFWVSLGSFLTWLKDLLGWTFFKKSRLLWTPGLFFAGYGYGSEGKHFSEYKACFAFLGEFCHIIQGLSVIFLSMSLGFVTRWIYRSMDKTENPLEDRLGFSGFRPSDRFRWFSWTLVGGFYSGLW